MRVVDYLLLDCSTVDGLSLVSSLPISPKKGTTPWARHAGTACCHGSPGRGREKAGKKGEGPQAAIVINPGRGLGTGRQGVATRLRQGLVL